MKILNRFVSFFLKHNADQQNFRFLFGGNKKNLIHLFEHLSSRKEFPYIQLQCTQNDFCLEFDFPCDLDHISEIESFFNAEFVGVFGVVYMGFETGWGSAPENDVKDFTSEMVKKYCD